MSAFNAKQQFNENLRLFGNAHTEPEKYNLYAGLANLAESIEQLHSELIQIQSDLRHISKK